MIVIAEFEQVLLLHSWGFGTLCLHRRADWGVVDELHEMSQNVEINNKLSAILMSFPDIDYPSRSRLLDIW